jgi:Tol biopolymer transport system component
MARRLLLAGLLALAVGAVDWAAPATSNQVQAASAGVPPASAGTILFVKSNDLWTMRADGSGQVQLTHEADGNFANNGVFSPDGTRIAYAVHTPWAQQKLGSSELHVMNADGSNDQVLVRPGPADGEWVDEPAWYGGGTSLLFVHDTPRYGPGNQWQGDSITLEGLNLANGSRSVLMQNAENPTTAGGALAWLSIPNNGTLGYQVNFTADGTNTKTLLTEKNCVQVNQPRLSPDGQYLAFSCSGAPGSGGSGPFGLFGLANLSLIPGAEAHGLPWDPYVIKTDGTGLRRLASIGGDEQAMAWSPDGKTLALDSYDGVFAMPASGGAMAKIVAGGDGSALDWKPGP